jgi:fructose-1,6-bisphosphatase/inositol monophosphatase family enzyme
MSQAWITVAGLCLDFLGFALIAWEWLLAQRAERAALEIAEAQERQQASRDLLSRSPTGQNPQMQRHMEAVAQIEARSTKSRLEETRNVFAKRRYGAIYAGMAMVVLGFALQLMGALPGCCRVLGIAPAN